MKRFFFFVFFSLSAISGVLPQAVHAAPEVSLCDGSELISNPAQEIALEIAMSQSGSQLDIEMPTPYGEVILELTENVSLLDESAHSALKGSLGISIEDIAANCLFGGKAYRAGKLVGSAAVSRCGDFGRAISGVVRIGNATYWLERGEKDPSQQLLRISGEEGQLAPHTQALTQGSPRYIELLIVNDLKRFQQFNSNRESLVLQTLEVANLLDGLYSAASFSYPLRVKLAKIITVSGNEPYQVPLSTTNPSFVQPLGLLAEFTKWIGNLPERSSFDVAVLLSGHQFEGNVVGVAYVGMMCSISPTPNYYSGGVIQAGSTNPTLLAATIAHELGHTLGAAHDGQGNSCLSSQHIMSPMISFEAPTTFSSCSLQSINPLLGSASTSCLLDAPALSAQCGNGIVESGEQCDCGMADCSSVDRCCSGATCTLAPGAVCSSSNGCCDSMTCRPAAQGTLCRGSRSSCDVAESCDGTSIACPGNSQREDGVTCTDNNGFSGSCFQGNCQSLDALCAKVGQDQFGEWWIGCDDVVGVCSSMLCQRIGAASCHSVFDLGGQVRAAPDGVSCGAGAYCQSGTCSAVDSCRSRRCDNGTCVNRNGLVSCDCDPGWGGEHCEINLNDCVDHDCENGRCIDQVDDYTCSCDPGWVGSLCEIPQSLSTSQGSERATLLQKISLIEQHKSQAKKPLRGSRSRVLKVTQARRLVLRSIRQIIQLLENLVPNARLTDPNKISGIAREARSYFRRAVQARGRRTNPQNWLVFEQKIQIMRKIL